VNVGRIIVVFVALLALGIGVARADVATAKLAYEKGRKAYNLKRFDDALAMFERAYDEQPDPAFLFNIGQCERQLGRYEGAVKSYRAYLAESSQLPDDKRKEVLQVIEEVQHADRQQRAAREAPPTTINATEAVTVPAATPVVVAPPPRRPWYRKPAGMTFASLGLAAAVVGAALMGASSAYSGRARAATTLPDQQSNIATADALMPSGIVVLSVGGASLVVGAVLLGVQK
jgi:tetratricopeptide (TPR) repeat protein